MGLVASMSRPRGKHHGSDRLRPEIMASASSCSRRWCPVSIAWQFSSIRAIRASGDVQQMEATARSLKISLATIRGPGDRSARRRTRGDDPGAGRRRCGSRRHMFRGNSAKVIATLAASQRLPAVGGEGFAGSGRCPELRRDLRGAVSSRGLLRRQNPSRCTTGDLPLEQPTKSSCVINQKAAKALDNHDPSIDPVACRPGHRVNNMADAAGSAGSRPCHRPAG
jgi:hypothetical protein